MDQHAPFREKKFHATSPEPNPNASITSMMLVGMPNIDRAGVFDQQPDGLTPFLLLDGHHSWFEQPFLSYINDSDEHPWVVCISMPYGTHIWHVADSSELIGTFKIRLTDAKNTIYAAKPNNMKKWLMSDVIPIINSFIPKGADMRPFFKQAMC